jgi:hypothetical protein
VAGGPRRDILPWRHGPLAEEIGRRTGRAARRGPWSLAARSARRRRVPDRFRYARVAPRALRHRARRQRYRRPERADRRRRRRHGAGHCTGVFCLDLRTGRTLWSVADELRFSWVGLGFWPGSGPGKGISGVPVAVLPVGRGWRGCAGGSLRRVWPRTAGAGWGCSSCAVPAACAAAGCGGLVAGAAAPPDAFHPDPQQRFALRGLWVGRGPCVAAWAQGGFSSAPPSSGPPRREAAADRHRGRCRGGWCAGPAGPAPGPCGG